MATKTYRGKLQDGKIEWIGTPPTSNGEVRIAFVRPKAKKHHVPMRFGMYSSASKQATKMSPEEEIAFIKSLAEEWVENNG